MQKVASDHVGNGFVWLRYSLANVGHRVRQTVLFVGGSDAFLWDQCLQALYELQFLWEKKFFHIVNIPIIMIKPKAYFKCNFVAEAFLVTKFSVDGISSYLECVNLRNDLHLGGDDLKICWFDFAFANFIRLIILLICDMRGGTIIMCDYQFLYACFSCGNIMLIYFVWLFFWEWVWKE